MKKAHMKTFLETCLPAALLLCIGQAFAATTVTVGVGHMCCGNCKTSATQSLTKVAENVKIEGDTITLTPKGEDLLPVLEALRKGGFPAKTLSVTGSVTVGVSHLCCANCRSGLGEALAAGKLSALDPSATKISGATVVIKAKAGKTLDLMGVIAAMEAGGFSASKVTLGTATARKASSSTRRVATR